VLFAVHHTFILGSSMPGRRSDFSRLGTSSQACAEFLVCLKVKVQRFEFSNTFERNLAEEDWMADFGTPTNIPNNVFTWNFHLSR
jgi:hypothetical protein